jgi:hypothetical protein
MKKLLLAITLFSCGTQQKLDKKAVSRVKANHELLDEVGQAWYKINPQEKDTIETYIKGEVIYNQVPILDKSKIDSIKNTLTEDLRKKCSESIDVAYTVGWNDCVTRFYLDELKVRVDTFIKQLPPDNRYQRLQSDSIRNLENLLAAQQAKTNSFEEQVKKLWNNIYIAIGVLVALGIVIGLLIKFKLFKNG